MNVPARFASKGRTIPYALAAALLAVMIGGLLWHREHAAGPTSIRRDQALVGGNSPTKAVVTAGEKPGEDAHTQPEQDKEGETADAGLPQRNPSQGAEAVSTLQELQAARQKELDEYRARVNRRTEGGATARWTSSSARCWTRSLN